MGISRVSFPAKPHRQGRGLMRPTGGLGGAFTGYDVSFDAVELGVAVQRYARCHEKRPDQVSAPEILRIAKGLGWRKVA